ncbi:hypothetical protein [Alicyclobacillus acidiphilus]|uniref:hypothetical protein n=1 Tax=Alicyclobacillus acidiphilus TaxID=182455 RepID=UPI00083056D5|nr:hypothetical protein [Alicyclobacillus acidiphilus]
MIYVMLIVVAVAALCTVLVYVARLSFITSERSMSYQKCSSVARSVAKTIVEGYASGASPTVQSWSWDGYDLAVGSSINAKGLDAVQVQAQLGDVSDTISFTYDTIAHKVSAWQDNGPGMTR